MEDKTVCNLVYKCESYRVSYKGVDYIVSFEWDDIGECDNSVVVEDTNTPVEDYDLKDTLLELVQ